MGQTVNNQHRLYDCVSFVRRSCECQSCFPSKVDARSVAQLLSRLVFVDLKVHHSRRVPLLDSCTYFVAEVAASALNLASVVQTRYHLDLALKKKPTCQNATVASFDYDVETAMP